MTQGGSNSAAGVREGDILAGKYRVQRVLGIGGMGVVVAAHHMQLDERVALKFLLPEALGNPEAVARFAREARAAVKIKSEHVARVSDVGTLPNGAPYMVMEYLEGGDLAAWLKQRGPLPIEQAVEFVLQACVAVADAHALGIVHRDLKPANLFCVRRSDGQLSIKVLDFGISKLTDLSGTGPGMAMTKTSALMGSPLYMSPEQMRSSKDVDAQTDIWALGIILFELMTGQSAFLAESVTELAIKVASEQAPLIRTFRPDVPPGLEAVISKCLEKDKRQRYRNVGELALALLPFAPKRAKASVERISGIMQSAGLSASALAVPASPPVDATRTSEGTLPPMGRTTLGASRGKTTALGLAFAGAIAVAITGTLFVVAKRAPAPASDPAPAANLPGVAAGVSPAVAPIEPAKPVEAKVADLPATPPPASPPAPVAASKATAKQSAPAKVPLMPPAAAAPAAAPPPPPPAPKAAAVNCDPPYYFNANGTRVFKKECL
ncbi:MAG: serine/threonine protein kinase [Polyangiaceae bacterium]